MTLSTSTVTLAPGSSRTYSLAPGEAVTVATEPNCYVTVTETPDVITTADQGGQTNVRTSILQYKGEWTYGPYALGGTVVVDVSLSKSTSSVSATLGSTASAVVGAGLPGRTLGSVGDSFIANGFYSDATQTTWYAKNPLAHALGLSNHPLTLISQQAVGGSRITGAGTGVAFYDQSVAACASGATDILIMGGINDALNSVSISAIIAEYTRIIDYCLTRGKRLWLCTCPTLNSTTTGYTVARQAIILELNRWLIERAGISFAPGNVFVIDTASELRNPASATHNWKANTILASDGLNLHPNNVGAYWLGKAIARAWTAYLPSGDRRIASNADAYGYSAASRNLIDNPLLVNGSGTATGFTSATSSGTASCTPTLEARADGYGNDQQLAITHTSGDLWSYKTPDAGSRETAGDIVQCEFELTVPAGTTGFRRASLALTQNGAGGFIRSLWMQPDTTATNDLAYPEAFVHVMRTPPMVVAAGQTLLQGEVLLGFNGSATQNIKLGRASLNRLFAQYSK